MGGGELGQSGKSALWAGFALMMLFNLIFGRAAYHSRSKTSVVYHLLSLLITLIAAMAYLVMALDIGDIWVRYADWLLSTPLLLVDLAFLAGMPSAQVLFLASVDMMMVGSGFAAQMAYKAEQKWPMFVFSCFLFGIIVVTLVQYMRSITRDSAGTVEAKAYRFLSIWTLGLWTIYPILFILDNTKTIGGDIEAIIHCILDILAKGIFGMILVGSREALEGENTAESLLAMAIIGIDPLKRRSSMVLPNGIDAMAGESSHGVEGASSAHVAGGSKGGGPLFPTTHGGSSRNLTAGTSTATASTPAALTRGNSGRMVPASPSRGGASGAASTTRFFPPGQAHAPTNPPGSSRRMAEGSDDLEAGDADVHPVASGSEAFGTSRPHDGAATGRALPRAPAAVAPAPAPAAAAGGGGGDMISALTEAAMRDPALLAALLQAATAQPAAPAPAPPPPAPVPAPAPAPAPAALPSPSASSRGRSGSFNAVAAAAASNPALMAAILQQLAAGGAAAPAPEGSPGGATPSRGSSRRLQ